MGQLASPRAKLPPEQAFRQPLTPNSAGGGNRNVASSWSGGSASSHTPTSALPTSVTTISAQSRAEKLIARHESLASPNHDTPHKAPPIWAPDESSPVCTKCEETVFSNVNRRHHCRACGALVCEACSGHRRQLARYLGYGSTTKRVCSSCAEDQDFLEDPHVGLRVELQRCVAAVLQDANKKADFDAEIFRDTTLADLEELAELLGNVYSSSALFLDEDLYTRGVAVLKRRHKNLQKQIHAVVVDVESTDNLVIQEEADAMMMNRTLTVGADQTALKKCRQLIAVGFMQCKEQFDTFTRALPDWLKYVIIDDPEFQIQYELDLQRLGMKLQEVAERSRGYDMRAMANEADGQHLYTPAQVMAPRGGFGPNGAAAAAGVSSYAFKGLAAHLSNVDDAFSLSLVSSIHENELL
eukprot:TRINITY_DN2162_c0_g1_i1.p1 TRINITY_DN2162_c0_g1~~TRINITY_DN2162_c0_g1_i1.p1  ORF type:complete len:454 (-),score=67.23 TRINITY_DN2162_c0_g1_i1:82-1317(-)